MKLLPFVTHIASRANLDLAKTVVNDQVYKDYIIDAMNFCRKYINGKHPWPWTEKTSYLQTVPNYTTGTVTVTQGQRTVTGSGTAFTSAMIGRFFKLTRESEIYRIKDVPSSTSLVLELPYIGATGSAQGFLIWNRFYSLAPDVPYLAALNLTDFPLTSVPFRKATMDDSVFQSWINSWPSAWAWYGVNRVLATYSTGTVSGTAGFKTLTGAGTSWLDNVFDGSTVVIGVNEYNIESVDSDTQITLTQNLSSSVAGSTPYLIRMVNRSQIALSASPDPARNLKLTYHKRTYNITQDDDELELWEQGELVLGNIVYAYIQEKLTSDKAFNWLNIAKVQIAELWQDVSDGTAVDTASMGRTSMPAGYRPGLYG